MLIISKGFVKIYNIGQSAALDVEFTEENFANDWSIVRLHCGDAKTSWKSIEPDSSVTHEIVVKPSKAGAQNITSAVLNYRPSSDSEETVRSFSSDYGVANIIPENEFLRNHASHGIDWLIFLVLTIPSILFPYMLYNKSVARFTKAKKN
ncbi:unnamed protein product [Oikopleura dioica]|uniref:Translocon-associated protein subunit beta n=1 Tax=Oikopleura dioica TaxID=34765 RepID=E4XAU3_OIKDI|nr:unnamed protein product [Oikopleura dioica]